MRHHRPTFQHHPGVTEIKVGEGEECGLKSLKMLFYGDGFGAVQFSLSVVSDSLWPHDCSPSGSSACGIFQASKYQSKVPFPSPGDLPDQGIEPVTLVKTVHSQ